MHLRLTVALVVMLVLPFCVIADDIQWSWNSDSKDNFKQAEVEPEIAGSEVYEETIEANSTEAEKIIDQILVSNREGRNVDGLDQFYSDPNVQEALQKGDDRESRNIIKDRLCHLGLMQCEGESVQEKRPYIAPEELIYAQPVAINPVGRPIPTIPVQGPVRGGGYGPPKPVPFPYGPPPPPHSSKFGPIPSLNKYGPPPSKFGPPPNKPPRRGYGPPPGFPKPQFGPPGKPFPGEIYDGTEFIPQPIEPDSPYKFEQGYSESVHHKDKKVEVVVNANGGYSHTGGSSGASGALLQHVHHHYHHNTDDVKSPTVVLNPIPLASAAVVSSQSGSSFLESQSANLFNKHQTSNGFTPVVPTNGGLTIGGVGLGGSYGGQTIASYGGNSNHGLSSFGGIRPTSENYGGPQTFDSNSFGTSVGLYGSSGGFYKKGLNLNSNSINSINNNYLQANYADKYQGIESARNENYDCVCVPYDQCPSHEVIGRKDDLYLPLDPRNLKSDIEALDEEERVITDGNGTMSIVRIAKGASLNETQLDVGNKEETKKVSKRETSTENTTDKNESQPEARQYGPMKNNNVKPTFGISFGLPNQGGGGYPINPYGPNPFVNPYGSTVGGQGINLGLVSINPLLSVQVSKNDYGDKIIKPFINLHVTPNNYLVHKFENLLAYKKGAIFNKHKHYHYHPHRPHFPYGPPNIFHKPHTYYGHHEHIPHEYPDVHPDHTAPIYNGHHEHYPSSHEFHGSKPHFYPSEEIHNPDDSVSYYDDSLTNGHIPTYDDGFYGRAFQNTTNFADETNLINQYKKQYDKGLNKYGNSYNDFTENYYDKSRGGSQRILNSRIGKSLSTSSNPITFPSDRKRRDLTENDKITKRQAYYSGIHGRPQTCGPRHVCCKRPLRPNIPNLGPNRGQCGVRHSQGINGRIKNPVYVDGDSEFGEYPWQVAILKKDPKESVYVCGGTLIDPLHIITAAHCVKTYTGFDLRVRLGEWDVNHDVEFYPYIERDVVSVNVHPEFYAGTLYNDIAVIRMDKPADFGKYPHISPACLPRSHDDYTGTRCWTTGWGKDAFGDFGKYQNILKEVDVPVVNYEQCQRQLQQTRLGYEFRLHQGFICAGGEEGKDACKGDGGGPMVCERGGTWQVVGIVSWGIGCGQVGIPGVYVKVAHYLDWIRQITQLY